ncbi:MAG: FAD-dependent oxidoreductase [Pseudonocardiaceae bacterium]|nr:FAD-dependent oxidoreductase [Pseudonocardiaceae bacterium]
MRVIVIGSGIAGVPSAYQLARRGVEVVLVDERHPGFATAAGAGIVAPWASRALAGAEYRLAAGAAGHYPVLVQQLAEDGVHDTSFEIVGGMVVSADEAELAEAQQRIGARAAEDPLAGAVRRLDPPQARELFPPLAGNLAAVHVSGAGRVDGRRLCSALRDAARARGARLLDGHAELALDGDRVTGVRVHGERLDADAVVVAAGAWTPELVAPLGVRLGVAPQRGQLIHLGLSGQDTAGWPVVLPVSTHYMLAFPDSLVVIGATRETGSGFDHRVTAAGQHEVLTEALRVAPGLAGATVLETRTGFRPLSDDAVPLLGPLDGYPNVLVATGYGASGLTVGPFAGQIVAALAVGDPPPIDLAAFRPERGAATG